MRHWRSRIASWSYVFWSLLASNVSRLSSNSASPHAKLKFPKIPLALGVGMWHTIFVLPLKGRDERSLISAGTAFRDAIARRRSAQSTRHRPETTGGVALVVTAAKPKAEGKTSE